MTREEFVESHGSMCNGKFEKVVDIKNASSGYEVHSCRRCHAKYWITFKNAVTQFTIVCRPRPESSISRQMTFAELF